MRWRSGMAGDIFAFYASHSPMPDPGEASALIEPLPNDAAALTHVIPGLGIYDVVARDFYGFEPPGYRLSEIHLRPIADRLARIMELDDQPLLIARKPERRALQRCNAFALMLVTMLRAKGVPARSRCGFAAYFNPPNFEDHWVCEYWDAQERRWRLADPQIDDVWRRAARYPLRYARSAAGAVSDSVRRAAAMPQRRSGRAAVRHFLRGPSRPLVRRRQPRPRHGRAEQDGDGALGRVGRAAEARRRIRPLAF